MENTQSQRGQVARVYVNGIEVGSMPTDQYKALVKEQNWRIWLHVKGIFNVFTFSYNVASRIAMATSIVIISILLVTCAVAPEGAAELINQLRQTEPKIIAAFMQRFVLLALVAVTFGTLLDIALHPALYGYINHIDLEINRKIRQLLEVPAEGDMRVEIEK